MPELPEVETVRRGLNQLTLNQPIQGGEVLLDRTIAHPALPSAFLAGLQGIAIAQWHRRGKYLLAELVPFPATQREEETKIQKPSQKPRTKPWSEEAIGARQYIAAEKGYPAEDSNAASHSPTLPLLHPPTPPPSHPPAGYLGVHLRMTGQLLWLDAIEPLEKHVRVRLFFPEGKELRFVDQRTFGQMWWVPPGEPVESVVTGLQQLGPEPFSDAFSVSYLVEQLKHRRRPVKNALLDQAIVAGIGNIYADEALFMSGIRPQTLCTDLSRNQFKRLHANIIQVLQNSIDANGTTFRTFRSVAGVNGNYGGVAWVYGRDGDTCRTCGTVIERLRMAGRSAHFCPKCQR